VLPAMRTETMEAMPKTVRLGALTTYRCQQESFTRNIAHRYGENPKNT
jgi:hypothetical protein